MRSDEQLRWNVEQLALEELTLLACLLALLAFATMVLVLLVFLLVL